MTDRTDARAAARHAIFAVFAIAIVGLALRLFHLGTQSLWYDEGYSVYLAGKDLLTLTGETAADIQPPLYYYLLHAWIALFGRGEASVRGLSVLFGLAVLPLFFLLGRQLFGPRAGLLAAALAALSPLYVWYAQETRMYTLLVWLTLAASYFLWRALQDDADRRGWLWAGWAVSTTLALYTHYFAAFVLGFHVLFAALVWRARRSSAPVGGFGIALLAVLVAYAPWLPNLLNRYGSDASYWSGQLKLDEAARKIAVSFSVGESVVEGTGQWLALGVGIALVFALAGLVVGSSRIDSNRGRAVLFLLLYLLVPVILLLITTYSSPKFSARYAMAASPALFLLLGAGLDELWRRRDVAARGTALLAGLFVAGVMVYANYGAFFDVRFTKPDFRGASRWIESHKSANEAVILMSGHAYPVFSYYYNGGDWYPIPADRTLDATHTLTYDVAADLNRVLAGKRGVWLTLWQDEVVDPNGYLTTLLDLYAESQPVDAAFYHVKVRHYALQPDTRFPEQPQIAHPVDVNFGNEVRLLGYTPALTDTVLLHWQAVRPLAQDYKVSLRLKDSAGHDWQRPDADRRLAAALNPTMRWHPGETVIARYELPAAPGTPPGTYELEAIVYADGAPQPLDVLDARGAPAGKAARLGPVDFPGHAATARELGFEGQPAARWGEEIALLRARTDRMEAQAGDQINVTLWWQRGKPATDTDYGGQFEWVQGERRLGIKALPELPALKWRADEVWRGQYTLDVPLDIQPGPAAVRVALTGHPDSQWKPVATVQILKTDRVFEAPSLSHAIGADFGGRALLLGANLSTEQAKAGGQVSVTLYWKALARIDKSYTAFVHVLDASSSMKGQEDHVPAAGARPTTGWVPGEVIEDRYEIAISQDSAPGDYVLEVGLYDASDPAFPRLPIVKNGQPGEDRFAIATIEVSR